MSFLAPFAKPLLGAGLSIAGDLFSSNQQSKDIQGATNAQVAAQQAGIDEMARQFDKGISLQEPRAGVGNAALAQLAGLYNLGFGGGGSAAPAPSSGGFDGIDIGGGPPTAGRFGGQGSDFVANLSSHAGSGGLNGPMRSILDLIEGPFATRDQPRMMGGDMQPGQDYIVGEDGPERVRMNEDGTAYVTPNPGTLADLAGFRRFGGVMSSGNREEGPLPGGNNAGPIQPLGPPQQQGAPWEPGAFMAGLNQSPASGGSDAYNIAPVSQQEAFNNFFTSPQYQFNLEEMQKAVERSAGARSGVLGGDVAKALQRYAGGLAAGEFGDYRNTLQSIAGLGQTAADNIGRLSANYGANQANMLNQQGATNASGLLGQANTQANAFGSIANTLGGIDWGSVFGNKTAAAPASASTSPFGGKGFLNDIYNWPPGVP